jgi:HSP20 family molecular chaperone IbpA
MSFHGAFFLDPFFKSSWVILEKQKAQYEKHALLKSGGFFEDLNEQTAFVDSENQFNTIKLTQIERGIDGANVDDLADPSELVEPGNYAPQYQVILDTQYFRPDEVKVHSRFSDKENQASSTLTIEGKHEEKGDPMHHGRISRRFSRTYTIPSDVELDKIEAHMSSDGILRIVLPKFTTAPSTPRGSPVQEAPPVEKAEDEGFVSTMKHRLVDPILHVLPDFHLAPFWTRWLEHKPRMGLHTEDKDLFRILVDVKDFAPEEIVVQCSEYELSIEAMHHEKRDQYGFLSREFCRSYDLPKSVNADDLSCELLSGGILQISAPKFVQGRGSSQGSRRLPVTINPDPEAQQE